MMKKKLTVLFTLSAGLLFSQTNEFAIGAFGYTYGFSRDAQDNIITSKLNAAGYPSSCLTVLYEDGFNIAQTYQPDVDISKSNFTNLVTLAKNQSSVLKGIKLMPFLGGYYKAIAPPSITGVNQYDMSGSPYNAIYHYDWLFDNIYNNSLYSSTIWGHQLQEEGSYYHSHPYPDQNPGYWTDTDNNDKYRTYEIDPAKTSDAIAYFKNKRLYPQQKIIVMEAKHGGFIADNLNDGQGYFNQQNYINQVNKPDVFLEGSYFSSHYSSWKTQDGTNPNEFYLGKFKSIDYAKARVPVVHAVVGDFNSDYVVNSSPSQRNGDQLWFQTYTSIIHGAQGIWFWELGSMYNPATYPIDGVNKWDPKINPPDKYNRSRFPVNYQRYVSNLSKELRYLVNQNLLSSDPNSVIYTKTTSADELCILPPSTDYLKAIIPGGDATHYHAINNDKYLLPITNPHRGEDYGLRYTLRTNGYEVIMIVSNPNPYSVHDVNFNFNSVSNPIISNATGVDVLFNEINNVEVNNPNYKVENDTYHYRSNTVDNSFNLLKKYHIDFTNKTFMAEFGAFDVKIFKFTSTPPVSSDETWSKVWSNNGDRTIGTWSPVNTTDKFIIGDFDGNGKEDLLAIQGAAANNWAVMQEYNETKKDWDWKWSNNGNNLLAIDWTLNAAHQYIVGDFLLGDGKMELLCISGTNGYANMYSYNNGTWNNWVWQNGNTAGLGKIASDWTMDPSHRYFVGDFTGDSKSELLCVSGTNGYVNMYDFNNGTWNNWMWQNSNTVGLGKLATDWPLSNSHRYFVGNFDGTGKDELLCVSGTNNWNNIYSFNAGWNWFWSNNGVANIAGWALPYGANDKLMVGNIDGDAKSELMLIQRGSPAAWAQTKDMEFNGTSNQLTYNWSNAQTEPYIKDWHLSDIGTTNNTNYFLMRTTFHSHTKSILAIRNNYGCGTNSNYLVSLYKASQSAYLKTAQLTTPSDNSFTNNAVQLYPNPNKGEFTLTISSTAISTGTLKIMDLAGRLVFENQNLQLQAGENSIPVNVKDLSKGIYFIQTCLNNTLFNNKVIID